MQRLRRILRGLAIAFVALLLALAAGEIVLRLAGWGTRMARYWDSDVGLRFLGPQTRMSFGRDGPKVPFTVNQEGLRGPWYGGPKPPGVARVMCLGDSFTFAWGIEDQHAYPLLLERLLEADLGPGRAQVANFGFPMFNTENELKAYRKLGRPFEPDIVVLGWFQNDVQPDPGGPPYTDSWILRLLGRTALMEFFHYRVRRFVPLFEPRRSPELLQRVREYQARFEEIETQPESDLARPYWEAGMAALRDLVREVRADGVNLLLVVFPAHAQVLELQAARRSDPSTVAELLAGPLTARQRRVTAEARSLDVPVLDLLAALGECDSDPFGTIDPGHPGPLFCQVTAEQVKRALFELGWLELPAGR